LLTIWSRPWNKKHTSETQRIALLFAEPKGNIPTPHAKKSPMHGNTHLSLRLVLKPNGWTGYHWQFHSVRKMIELMSRHSDILGEPMGLTIEPTNGLPHADSAALIALKIQYASDLHLEFADNWRYLKHNNP